MLTTEGAQTKATRGRVPRVNLIRATIDALPPAEGTKAFYADTRVAGLQLIVTRRGVKSWYLYRRTGPRRQPKRHFLGHYPDLTPELARRKAEQWRANIANGSDPTATREAERARGVTFAQAFEAFSQARGSSLKARTLHDYRRFLEPSEAGGAAPFGDWRNRAIVSITKDQVSARHRALTAERGAAQADYAMRFLRSLINFARYYYESAEGVPLVAENPVQRLNQAKSWNRIKGRSNHVKPHEFQAWFDALKSLRKGGEASQGALVADYLELLVLTGLRRSEAAQLRRADVDLKDATLTIRDPKNREEHTLPLSDRLLEILRARLCQAEPGPAAFVFPGEGAGGYLVEPRRPMRKVIEASEVQFSLHDLRRTFATVAERLDIPAYALKRLLNHKMRNDVTAGYIVPSVDRLRGPMQKVTDFILGHAGLRPSAKVIALDSMERPA